MKWLKDLGFSWNQKSDWTEEDPPGDTSELTDENVLQFLKQSCDAVRERNLGAVAELLSPDCHVMVKFGGSPEADLLIFGRANYINMLSPIINPDLTIKEYSYQDIEIHSRSPSEYKTSCFITQQIEGKSGYRLSKRSKLNVNVSLIRGNILATSIETYEY